MPPHAIFDGGLLEARVTGIGIDRFINLEAVRSMEKVLRFQVTHLSCGLSTQQTSRETVMSLFFSIN